MKKPSIPKMILACILSIILPLFGTMQTYASGKMYAHGGIHLYVSKMNYTLTLYRYSTKIDSWVCNLGTYSASGDKSIEGDRTTPTGEFYICTRNDQSDCYLSLGLSYPGIEDANRGYEQGLISLEEKEAIIDAISKGECPPWDTALGGAIMIHGNYEEGRGTAGCVAVANEVMDILWGYGEIGVPVTIGP